MRTKQIILAAFILMMGVGYTASAKKKTVRNTKPTIVKVDTVSVDTFSYAIGMAQSGGLKPYLAQQLGVDTTYMDDFLSGLKKALDNTGDKKVKAYAAGLQIGQEVMERFLPGINKQITDKEGTDFINENLFKQGFFNAVSGDFSKMKSEKAVAIAQKQMNYYNEVNAEKKYGENRKKGEAFLAANAKKDSVITTPSGLQYKILKKGTGAIPTDTSTVKVNYEGRLIDGTVFDSSYKRKTPNVFKCNQVIKGWTEALTRMPVGSTWEIYIPQELAYGAQQQRVIPPFSVLIFKVELLSIEK